MVWVTWWGVWSEEPSVRHFPLPVWAAKTTRLSCPPSTSAVSSTVPVAPAAGALRVTAGFAAGSASLPDALRTIAEPAGTVTVIFRSAPLVTEASVPWMLRKAMRAEPVAKVAFFASSALLKATTYSVVSWPVRVPVAVREKA
ncbi:hypothetical protein SHIRM173S_10584 [Streptomyces hirsutus]